MLAKLFSKEQVMTPRLELIKMAVGVGVYLGTFGVIIWYINT